MKKLLLALLLLQASPDMLPDLEVFADWFDKYLRP